MAYNPAEQGSLQRDAKEMELEDDQYVIINRGSNPKHHLHVWSPSFGSGSQVQSKGASPMKYSASNSTIIIPTSYQFPQESVNTKDGYYSGECLTLHPEELYCFPRGPNKHLNVGNDVGFFKCTSPPLEVTALDGFKSTSPAKEYLTYPNYQISRQYQAEATLQLPSANFPAICEPLTPPESIHSLHRHKILMGSDISTSSGSTISTLVSRGGSADGDGAETPKPKIETTYWEDEDTKCYQVKARGVLVSRREDNNYVNGTKLLNVIGMSRGKRDGILKAEKNKIVIKLGSMNLKGVWIPFERAAEIARNNGVDADNILGPLFIEDIKTYFETTGFRLRVNECNHKRLSAPPPPPKSKNTLYLEMKNK